jgi:NDP-hexose 4-ketoreductase
VTQTRVVLFGANGFLGSHIAQALQANDLELFAFSRVAQHDIVRRGEATQARRCWFGVKTLHVRPALDLVTTGITGISNLLEDLKPTVIVNAVGALIGSESELEAANLTAVQNLLEAAQKTSSRARVIHLGSAAEYGFTQPGSSVNEDAICNPIGMYANLKLKATQLMLEASLETVTLRIANPVGPGTPETLLPGAIAKRLKTAILENASEIRSGPLSDYRSYVDARDIAQAVLTVARAENPPRLINIASPRAVQVREVVTELVRLSGFQGELIEENALASNRSSAVPWQQADISRALALGWKPTFSLQQSLEDLWLASGRSTLRPYGMDG